MKNADCEVWPIVTRVKGPVTVERGGTKRIATEIVTVDYGKQGKSVSYVFSSSQYARVSGLDAVLAKRGLCIDCEASRAAFAGEAK